MYRPWGQGGVAWLVFVFCFTVVFFGFLLLCFGVFVCLFAVLGFSCSMPDLVP